MSSEAKEIILKGSAASPGIAIGSLCRFHSAGIRAIAPATKSGTDEKARFFTAVDRLKDRFGAEKQDLGDSVLLDILEAEELFLIDPYFLEETEKLIEKDLSAEQAIALFIEKQKNAFINANSTSIGDKIDELNNLKAKLLEELSGERGMVSMNSVILADNLAPLDILSLKKYEPVGFISVEGGITSHSAIICRSLEFPAVFGLRKLPDIKADTPVIVDGFEGRLIINPSGITIKAYESKLREYEQEGERLKGLINEAAETASGKAIKIMANIDLPEEIDKYVLYKCAGFGLVRTEHLIESAGKIPTEEEQYRWYDKLAEKAYPLDVRIRLFDIGSDKHRHLVNRKEDNPALGLRGIRYLIQNDTLLKSQVLAILRASGRKNLKIMIPMVSMAGEVLYVRQVVEEMQFLLDNRKEQFDRFIHVGAMIETPSAALIAEELAEVSDFFSIGSNDLTQYTLAVDRGNKSVCDIYDAEHPSILKLIEMTAAAARAKGIECCVCGEMAAMESSIGKLISLGIETFSVSPANILKVKKTIRGIE